jgi:hypothetical protein
MGMTEQNAEKVRLTEAEKARIAAMIPEAEYGEYDAERMRFEVGQGVVYVVAARVANARADEWDLWHNSACPWMTDDGCAHVEHVNPYRTSSLPPVVPTPEDER